ncbi:I78 family peptidase inhibitor [Paracoccus cavernae]|uniref:I78 family peptidase inhibitor n=1 Tax=Paracoccus cavernae TaxID=1571207 RepID=A0ABT8DBZ4_9RHOB|nr:I78 family peptidase inhibitor [Paracoccus cavernae]
MKLFAPLALLSATLLLAACETDGTQVAIDAPVITDQGIVDAGTGGGPDACGAARYAGLVGQTSPQISVPAGTVHRSMRDGDPVTLDLQPARINFLYDRSGKLIKVSCG